MRKGKVRKAGSGPTPAPPAAESITVDCTLVGSGIHFTLAVSEADYRRIMGDEAHAEELRHRAATKASFPWWVEGPWRLSPEDLLLSLGRRDGDRTVLFVRAAPSE